MTVCRNSSNRSAGRCFEYKSPVLSVRQKRFLNTIKTNMRVKNCHAKVQAVSRKPLTAKAGFSNTVVHMRFEVCDVTME